MTVTKLFLVISLMLLPTTISAQEVFLFGSGTMPDPRLISADSDTDLNPLFALGGVSANDVGAWSSGTSYAIGDKVTINGLSYVARQAHTAAASFATDGNAGKWVLYSSFQRGSFNVGRFLSLANYGASSAWASSTVYGFGSRVTWNGVQYTCWRRHTSSANFANDINSNYWILHSSAPSLSSYTMESPNGSSCDDFDAYFQSGETTLEGTVDLTAIDPAGTGEDARGTLSLKITFDWEEEELKDYKLTLNMTSYPNMLPAGAYKASWVDGESSFTEFSFHTSSYNWNNINRCGRFLLTFSKSHSVPENDTIYSSSSVFAKAHIAFKSKGGRYVPVLSFLSTTPNSENNTEYYTSIWNEGVLSYFNLETSATIME